jgi:hypothetical protein
MTAAAIAGTVAAADAAAGEIAAAAPTAGREQAAASLPPLIPLTASLFVITGIRAALALAALGTLLAVFGRDQSLRLAFAGGAGVMTIAALARARGSSHFELREAAEPWPSGARRASWPRVAFRAAYPSTIGLAGLIAIAGPINATLAAVLAGFELGLGLMSLVLGAESAFWESRAGEAVAYSPGVRPRFFSRPRAHRPMHA